MKKPYRTTSCFRDPMVSGIDPEKPQPAKDLATIKQEKQKQKITSRISSTESRVSIAGPKRPNKYERFFRFPIDGGSCPVRSLLYDRSLYEKTNEK